MLRLRIRGTIPLFPQYTFLKWRGHLHFDWSYLSHFTSHLKMVAWLTSFHSCTSIVEWNGSCVFDLQSGGQFLIHNFVVKAQITSLQQKSENNEGKGNTFHLYFQWQCVEDVMAHAHFPQCTLFQCCDDTCRWPACAGSQLCDWHTHVIHHAHCPNTVKTHAGDQHVQCYITNGTCMWYSRPTVTFSGTDNITHHIQIWMLSHNSGRFTAL